MRRSKNPSSRSKAGTRRARSREPSALAEWRLAQRLHRARATQSFKRKGYRSFRLYLHDDIGIAPSRGMRLVTAYAVISKLGIPLSELSSIRPNRIYAVREHLDGPQRDAYLNECRAMSARALEFRHGIFPTAPPELEGMHGEDVVKEEVPNPLDRARRRTLLQNFTDLLSTRDPEFISTLLRTLARSLGRDPVHLQLLIELAAHLDPVQQGGLVTTMILEPGFSPVLVPQVQREIIEALRTWKWTTTPPVLHHLPSPGEHTDE